MAVSYLAVRIANAFHTISSSVNCIFAITQSRYPLQVRLCQCYQKVLLSNCRRQSQTCQYLRYFYMKRFFNDEFVHCFFFRNMLFEDE